VNHRRKTFMGHLFRKKKRNMPGAGHPRIGRRNARKVQSQTEKQILSMCLKSRTEPKVGQGRLKKIDPGGRKEGGSGVKIIETKGRVFFQRELKLRGVVD